MKISSLIPLVQSIIVFIVLCLNVLYFYISLFIWAIGIETKIFQPIFVVFIPIILFANMISLLYACDYESNLTYFYKLIKSDRIKIGIYASMGLINPLLLYIHTKSYNHFVRPFGILRCFPIINIFMYMKLIKEVKKRGYENNYISLYLRGMLILTLIREDKS